ncbi:MAG TPA: dTDP-4-dehydrorhamnose reductase [Bacteroidota bacterium]
MKRILICGSNGLLGQRLSLMLSALTEYEVLNTCMDRTSVFDHKILLDYTQLDITNKKDVKSLVSSYLPGFIINAAAETNVDLCETNRELAWNVNVHGVENLVEACRKTGATLIHTSTDYIFDGKKSPYREDDQPCPLSYYGKTKLASENAIKTGGIHYSIVRSMFLYGYGINVKKNFALWVIDNLKAGKRIKCVDDQIGNPTHVRDFATSLIKTIELDREGIYHICGSETISRYDFAVRIAKEFRLDDSLIDKVKMVELNFSASRPLHSSFITDKAERELGIEPLNVRMGLTLLKQELEQQRKN